MLLQLAAFPEIPRPHCVVQTAGPQLGPIRRDVYTARTVCVSLELSVNIIIIISWLSQYKQ